jgi:rare lipoprotein A (peptidoglycan hydrolase)
VFISSLKNRIVRPDGVTSNASCGTPSRIPLAAYYRPLLILAASGLLYACAQTQGPPVIPPTLSGLASPIPHSAPTPHAIVGTASWYGPGFEGRKTASGETLHEHGLTAASNTLPLGSHVKVTNLSNGRSVQVRINDCGPFVDGRKIDLTKCAADRLSITHSGAKPVRIEVLDTPADAHRCVAASRSHRKSSPQHRRDHTSPEWV